MAYKLLLADDSITIQKVVELTLTEEGFDVTAVGDGAAAFDIARKLMPDIVLADVFMPKMDGYELCEKLKGDQALKGVPVVLLSGTFEDFDEVRAARVGASDSLTKPFESSDLIAKVKRLVVDGKAASAGAAKAPPAEEPLMAAEVMEAAPVEAADDLWSVVDMGSDSQPLADATQVLSEEDLWKRANLLSDAGEAAPSPKEEEALPWGSLTDEPVTAALEAEDAVMAEEDEPFAVAALEEDESDKTAILNMDDLQASAYGVMEEDTVSVELSEVSAPVEITPFESLEQATVATAYVAPPPPPPRAAAPPPVPSAVVPAAVSEDMIRREVTRIVEAVLDKKVREAISGISREMVEDIVWEVVPELAEEILKREIEKLKAGIR